MLSAPASCYVVPKCVGPPIGQTLCLGIIGSGPNLVSLGLVRNAAIVVRRDVLRVEPDDFGEVGDGLVVFLLHLPGIPAIVVNRASLRLSRMASLKSAMALCIPLLVARVAAIVIGQGVLGSSRMAS